MDRYEYKVKFQEINNLIDEKEYFEAAAIADTIDWEKKPVPEKFIKADEQMRRDAARKKEQKYKDFEADEDIEDRVERLSKSSFTVEDEEESDDSDDDASSDEQSDSEADDSSEESSDAESTDGDQEVEK